MSEIVTLSVLMAYVFWRPEGDNEGGGSSELLPIEDALRIGKVHLANGMQVNLGLVMMDIHRKTEDVS